MRKTAAAVFATVIIGLFLACLFSPAAVLSEEEEKPAISSAGKGLLYPQLLWSRKLPGEISGVDMAEETGAVVVSNNSRVYYIEDGPDAEWTAGDDRKWKFTNDLAISKDGTRVAFQSDDKKKKTTEKLELTIHYYDGEGNRLWEKPNPYRYENMMLSPTGKYILIGEMMHQGTKVYDYNLNKLWEKEMQFWYLAFDPTERYIFDGEGGILYSLDGEQVWDFGRYTRILSVSEDAEYVMTAFYRQIKGNDKMFLMARKQLKKIVIHGSGGCVSPDGTYTAYVNSDGKLVVYRTKELLTAGSDDLPPLYKDDMERPWAMNISRDNRSLFVLGRLNQLSSIMMLVDLTKMKTAWKKTAPDDLRVAHTTSDNRYIVVKFGKDIIKKYKAY